MFYRRYVLNFTTYDTLAKKKTTEDYDKTQGIGMVYSAVVRQHGKRTSVKTMATPQDEDTGQMPDTVQPTEGMVYSAVIRQDGKKTSVKITVE